MRPEPQPPPPWLIAIYKAVVPLLPPDFVGTIRIACFKGGISTTGLEQTFAGRYEEPTPPADCASLGANRDDRESEARRTTSRPATSSAGLRRFQRSRWGRPGETE